MEKRVIKVDQRVVNTKHSVRKLRQKGYVPGVLYGKKAGNIPISVHEKDLSAIGGAQLFEVVLPGGSYHAVVRELQREPLHKQIRHVDFLQVDLNELIRTQLPVTLVGEARGTKEGGVIQAGERSLEVEGYPAELPETLEVDVSSLGIGDKLTVGDLSQDLSFKVLHDPDTVLAVVVATRTAATEEEAEPAAVEGGAEEPAEE